MKLLSSALLILCLCICYSSYSQSTTIKEKGAHLYRANTDTLTPKQVITKFLKWYKINLHKANSFPILIKDSVDNFMINKSAGNKYLSFLKSSGCLSSRYIAYWKSFIDDKAIGLQNNPLQSDIPADFDLDFILRTQEPELVLNHISEMKFQTVSARKNDMVIGLRGPQKEAGQYNFEMHKGAAGWQIDYISTPNFD